MAFSFLRLHAVGRLSRLERTRSGMLGDGPHRGEPFPFRQVREEASR